MLSSSMRSRTSRYENREDGDGDSEEEMYEREGGGEEDQEEGDRVGYGRKGRHRGAKNGKDVLHTNPLNALDMNEIMSQTLVDLKQLQVEKDEIIENLRRELNQKEKDLEESHNRTTTVRHYSNLLIRSSNIYVNKNPLEITESDKVPWSSGAVERHSYLTDHFFSFCVRHIC